MDCMRVPYFLKITKFHWTSISNFNFMGAHTQILQSVIGILYELLCLLTIFKFNNRSTIQNEWNNKDINMHNNSYNICN
jgi:hypothetical protein